MQVYQNTQADKLLGKLQKVRMDYQTYKIDSKVAIYKANKLINRLQALGYGEHLNAKKVVGYAG